MPRPFHELRERLLRAGVAPRHVRRYLAELSEHLSDLKAEEVLAGRSQTEAQTAALARLGSTDELARAMIGKRQLHSWSARAPWAMFGLVPVGVLAVAYRVALFIFWTGWHMFLPGTDTPFVRIDGAAILYFGVGRMISWCAPVFIGWGMAIIAARQRLNAAWPAIGLVVIAFLGCISQVHAYRPIPGRAEHVGISLTLGPSFGALERLTYALVVVFVTLLPYLIWRLQRARSIEE